MLDHCSVVEYWKSAPYLLNFMDDYALKRRFRREVERGRNGDMAGTAPGQEELASPLG